LTENAECKKENQRLHDIIDEDLANLKERVNNTEDAITNNSLRIDTAEESIDENQQAIDELVTSVGHLPEVPVGTILSWVSRTKDAVETVDLPDGWVRCDGGTIPHPSIWAGKYTPNLNGEKRFLRGGTDIDQLTLEEDQMQDHMHNIADSGHTHGYIDRWTDPDVFINGQYGPEGKDTAHESFSTTHDVTTKISESGISVKEVSSSYRRGAETRPKNMNVIYIMRVW